MNPCILCRYFLKHEKKQAARFFYQFICNNDANLTNDYCFYYNFYNYYLY